MCTLTGVTAGAHHHLLDEHLAAVMQREALARARASAILGWGVMRLTVKGRTSACPRSLYPGQTSVLKR
jgi:hypothetical protein